MKRVLLIAALLVLAAPAPARAQGFGAPPGPGGGQQPAEMSPDGAEINLGYFGDIERQPPYFEKVTYLVVPPAATMAERIDRLLHGLRTPVAPEHDHYGYEIRRYMARVGDEEIYTDPERLEEELMNAGRAAIIVRHWREALQKQIDEVEAQLEQSPDPSASSKFKYASGTAKATLGEIDNWIANNKKLLELLKETQGFYKIEYPSVTFDRHQDRQKFLSIYEAKQKSLQNIQDYTPWAGMVY